LFCKRIMPNGFSVKWVGLNHIIHATIKPKNG
jgi:hypothetical protein